MMPILMHFAIFLLQVSTSIFGLAWAVRGLARRHRVDLPDAPSASPAAVIVGIGAAGVVGQIVFYVLAMPLHVGLFPARIVAYAAAGALVAVAAERIIPFVSRKEALLFGTLGGVFAEACYAVLLRPAGENAARIASELVLAAAIALAVRLPLPVKRPAPVAQDSTGGCKACAQARNLVDGHPNLTNPAAPPPAPALKAPTFGPRPVTLRRMPTTAPIALQEKAGNASASSGRPHEEEGFPKFIRLMKPP
jgi:hypothetical protein